MGYVRVRTIAICKDEDLYFSFPFGVIRRPDPNTRDIFFFF